MIVKHGTVLSGIYEGWKVEIDDDRDGATGGYYLFLSRGPEGFDYWFENESYLSSQLDELEIGWVAVPPRSSAEVGGPTDGAPRIFFDTNEAIAEGLYSLHLPRSREDLDRVPGGPRAGLVITIYMPNELEMPAILQIDRDGVWVARPLPATT